MNWFIETILVWYGMIITTWAFVILWYIYMIGKCKYAMTRNRCWWSYSYPSACNMCPKYKPRGFKWEK